MGTIRCHKCKEIVDAGPRFCPKCNFDRSPPPRPGEDPDKTGIDPLDGPTPPAQLGDLEPPPAPLGDPTPPPAQLLFGRFRVVRLLGHGGMGTVYHAVDTQLDDEPVAVKILHPELASKPEARARLRREVLVARKLDYAHIVRVYEYYQDTTHSGFVMELLHGASLAEHLSPDGPQSPFTSLAPLDRLPWVAALARQFALALDPLHRRGLVHRDIKPSNVMVLDPPGNSPADLRCKLLDFGVVWHGPDSGLTDRAQPGTVAYMAPELQPGAGGEPTPASDLFGLGKILYWALTRKPPVFLYNIKPPSKLIEGLPADLDGPLLSCFGEPEQRPASAGELAGVFERVVAEVERLEAERLEAERQTREREYHYRGPAGARKIRADEIVDLIESYPDGDHRLWQQGFDDWKPWSEVVEISDLVRAETTQGEREDVVSAVVGATTTPGPGGATSARKRRQLGVWSILLGLGGLVLVMAVSVVVVALVATELSKPAPGSSYGVRDRTPSPIDDDHEPPTSPRHNPPEPAPSLVGTVLAAQGYEMKTIKPGSFQMGSSEREEGRHSEEAPQHEVRFIRPFDIGTTEVTQALYMAVMEQNPSHFEGDNLPVENVSWCDAVLFCNRLSAAEGLTQAYPLPAGFVVGMDRERCDELAQDVKLVPGANGYRLPTEAEWEFAARAGTTTRFWSGASESDLARVGWYAVNSDGKTHLVGEKKSPNARDLHDVHGNVREWCEDDWHSTYAEHPEDGSAWIDSPRGSHRVFRGGSWSRTAGAARVADRHGGLPGGRDVDLGFRLARDSSDPSDP